MKSEFNTMTKTTEILKNKMYTVGQIRAPGKNEAGDGDSELLGGWAYKLSFSLRDKEHLPETRAWGRFFARIITA